MSPRGAKPDRVFDDTLEIDLGDRKMQLCHFGPGNTPGDTIVYEPTSRVAWTGNFLTSSKTLPMLLEAGPLEHLETVTLHRLVHNFHRLNVLSTYRHLETDPVRSRAA